MKGVTMLYRRHYLDKLILYKDTEFIKVITGVRRSGKSFLLKMLESNLKEEDKQILFINFEHPETFHMHSATRLYEYIKEEVDANQKVYFLFDEIQEVDGWQTLINGLRVAFDCDIYITGSNATLLSGEMATYLSGRYVEIKIYPFSFSEILEAKSIGDKRGISDALQSYIRFGGFPSVVALENDILKQDVLKGIYNSIILKDVTLRGQVANQDMLQRIALYMMDNIGNTISSNKIRNYFVSSGHKVSHETIEKYLSLLEHSFIFYKAVRYDIRGKERLKTLAKYYVVDTGLRNTVLGRLDTNMGSQLENIVFLKLKQSGYEVFVGKMDQLEIDFVCFKNETVLYVQVALNISLQSKRDLDNLLRIKDNYKKCVVTMNYHDVGMVDGIVIIHIEDFLLADL